MRARVPLIVGNWKMHHGGARGLDLADGVARLALGLPRIQTVVAPPFTAIAAVAQQVAELAQEHGSAPIGVAAQNVWFLPNGAYTGEVSAEMLVEAGASWVIIGHSERRAHFRETDDQIAAKAKIALENRLHPIICVGEQLDDREEGRTLQVVMSQLAPILDLVVGARGSAVVAYEPVWAIGTGRVATPTDAQAVHAAIRERLVGLDATIGASVRVLYGGSVNGSNAPALLAQPDIDGALVGGASLDVDAFGSILHAAEAVAFRGNSA